ncbi:hypothetical protein ACH4ND_04890 [Streptomyces sp. NPDC017179]|uniref:hypothetical protein n=1 Tax=Streptomyces sp. NPDC017179 TaxID=3364979 RepID=UPI0037BA9562
MTTTQLQGLISMAAVLGLLVLMVLPSAIGIVHDRRADRRIRQARQDREAGENRDEAQKSSSRSTVPSTATWYADGRRSKKLVSS